MSTTERALANAAYGGRYPDRTLNDELLFALLSRHALGARASIGEFAQEMFAAMPGNEQDDIRRALVDLPRAFRKRRRSAQFDTYRSTPLDFVRQLAVYSANLATLSIRFGDPEVGFRLVDGATLVNHSRDSPHLIFLVEMTTALPWWAGIFGIPLESVMG